MRSKIPLTVFIIVIILGGLVVYQRFFRNNFELPRGEAVPLGNSENGAIAQSGVSPTLKSTRQIFVTEGTKHSIPLGEIFSGGPPKDGIPAIDIAKTISLNEADFLSGDSIGLGLEVNGEARFYPYQILVWHEIANDTVAGVPVLVTYCPLCATGIVFERKIPSTGEITTFGVSGRLWQSNLLMYNRTQKGQESKESLWSQVLGEAVVGEFTGDKLKIIRSDTVRFDDWKRLHPNTKVLSKDTGSLRPYGSDPYGDYYTDPNTIFPTAGDDARLFSKAFVLGVEVNGKFKAYESTAIDKVGVLNDTFVGKKLLVVKQPDTGIDIQGAGVVRIFERATDGRDLTFELKGGNLFDKETGTQWGFSGEALSGSLKGKRLAEVPFIPGFWFSWVAVHPETELFR